MRTPDFESNLLKVLQKQKPERPTLFEFLISAEAEEALADYRRKDESYFEYLRFRTDAFYHAGYDFVPMLASKFVFPKKPHLLEETHSLNDGAWIVDRESFEKYQWPDPMDFSYEDAEKATRELPDGMKAMIYQPDGLLENVIALTGYDNLCYMLADDRELVGAIFKEVGDRLISYLRMGIQLDNVGLVFINDDWGFRTSTMISHDDLREFVFPYAKKAVDLAHQNGLPCAIHSCGNFRGIFEEFYEVIGLDGKHSYEDTIMPVEDAYEKYADKIAILGGIDIDFLCRAPQEDIVKRCRNMLSLSESRGGYALGSGNSIAKYVPLESYFAMLRTVNPDLKINK